ncbi:hypothetical protein JCM16138_05860 [Thermococcus atlanticus]
MAIIQSMKGMRGETTPEEDTEGIRVGFLACADGGLFAPFLFSIPARRMISLQIGFWKERIKNHGKNSLNSGG